MPLFRSFTSLVAGKELGSAIATSDQTVASGAGTPDITGVTTTVTVGTRGITIFWGGIGCYNATVGCSSYLHLLEDGVAIGSLVFTSSTAGAAHCPSGQIDRSPSAGSHTYKLQMQSIGGSGVAHTAAGATQPTYVRVVER